MQQNFGGGRPLPEDYTINSFVYICVSINFIDTWTNLLANNFAWCCCTYQENMEEILKNIPSEISTPTLEDFKKKCQTILTDLGGDLYLNTMRNPNTPTKKTRLSKKHQQE